MLITFLLGICSIYQLEFQFMKFSKNIFHLNLPTYQLMPYDDPCLLNTADRFSSRLARFLTCNNLWQKCGGGDFGGAMKTTLHYCCCFTSFLRDKSFLTEEAFLVKKTHSTYERCACKGHLKATATGIRHDGHHRATGGHSKTRWTA